MISTNGEERIARLISEAVWRTQMVSVEKSNTKETYLEVLFGLFNSTFRDLRLVGESPIQSSRTSVIKLYTTIP